MVTFAAILSERGIDPAALVTCSTVLERARVGGVKRWRGVSRQLVDTVLRGGRVSRRVRGKVLRALKHVLGTDFDQVWTQSLFEPKKAASQLDMKL